MYRKAGQFFLMCVCARVWVMVEIGRETGMLSLFVVLPFSDDYLFL
jgi:hypothetical protein